MHKWFSDVIYCHFYRIRSCSRAQWAPHGSGTLRWTISPSCLVHVLVSTPIAFIGYPTLGKIAIRDWALIMKYKIMKDALHVICFSINNTANVHWITVASKTILYLMSHSLQNLKHTKERCNHYLVIYLFTKRTN